VLLLLGLGTLARDGESTTILDESSFWRFHVTLRKPVVPAAALRAIGKEASEAAVLPVKVSYRSYTGIQDLETEPPPAEWAKPDFDDLAWPRARVGEKWHGSVAHAAFGPGVGYSTGLLCLRGKFAVGDPSLLKAASLSLKYRGGLVVYLNGQEVARGGVPEGKLTPSSPAIPYPPEAFTDARGKPLPGPYHADKRIKAGERDLAERLAKRDRSLGPVAVPLEALRKGVNVLAIELHRSDYHPSALSWFQEPHSGQDAGWVPVGLLEVRLAAEGSGLVANVSRPKGLQLWNHDINDRVNVLDFGDPNEGLRPITLVAARNGAFSGQVVVGSTEPIRGLRATVGDLQAASGTAGLSSSGAKDEGTVGRRPSPATGSRRGTPQIRLRFPRLDGHSYGCPDWFDGIQEEPPPEIPVHKSGGAVQPVWVTVRVPRDAKAGDYNGQLTLSVQGAEPIAVPIHLRVADWCIPDPRDFRTYVGIYQSPTSLALHYNVPEWSEEHWSLMERSLELLGQVGNKIVNIPLSDRTQFGNDAGMVYWVRKPDGSFDYDFTVFDRYIRLVKKHLRPDFLALHLWHSGGWETRKADQENTVTVVDKKSGKREHMQVPRFGTEESKRFWKPVLDAIRERLAAEGLEKAMCLGILSDGTAPPEVFKAFDEIVPGGAKWTRGCHSPTHEQRPYALKGGGTVVCHEFVYGSGLADPAKGLPPIWKQLAWPGVSFIRHNFDDTLSLLKYRTMAERGLYCGTRGFGRIGLDFWDVLEPQQGRARNVYNRWPHSSCAQREPNLFRLASPGPEGAIPTVRFEHVREGVQDAEAMLFVAEAMGEHSDQLGPELTARCRQLFLDRLNYCRRTCPEAYGRVYFTTNHYGWQSLTARLYATAAEVAKKLGSR
jgi:hypothetical protein